MIMIAFYGYEATSLFEKCTELDDDRGLFTNRYWVNQHEDQDMDK